MTPQRIEKWLRRQHARRKKQRVSSQCTLCKKPPSGSPRVMWVLGGDMSAGSSRIKGHLPHMRGDFEGSGWTSYIAYQGPIKYSFDAHLHWQRKDWKTHLEGLDIAVIETYMGNTLSLLKDCRQANVKTILVLSDLDYNKLSKEMLELVDCIVVSSICLAEQGSSYHGHIRVVDDACEVPSMIHRNGPDRGNHPALVWTGSLSNYYQVEFLNEVLNDDALRDLQLYTITNHPDASHQYDHRTVWELAASYDIAVIPCRLDDWGKCKSSNRLVSFQTMGFPVVASRVPSYEPYLTEGETGFYADTIEEWRKCLVALRDPNLRESIGAQAASNLALAQVSPEACAMKWVQIYDELMNTA